SAPACRLPGRFSRMIRIWIWMSTWCCTEQHCPVAVIPIGLVSGGNFHADVQAGTVSGASGPVQSLPMVWIRQPADHGVTVTQFQNLAAQPEWIHSSPGADDQDALRVQSRGPQPLLADGQRRINQAQPSRAVGLAQVPQDGGQQLQALTG